MYGQKLMTIPYDRQTFLPRMTLFRQGTTEKTLQALAGCVTSETNQNLSGFRRTWLQWHFKLGHLGFEHVQLLGLGGFLDKMGLGLTKQTNQAVPKCAACQFGRQSRTPSGSKHVTIDKTKEGALKRDVLEPGERIFMDQVESRVRGRLVHTSGREQEADKYCGSTLFCDAASGFIHVEHQVSFTANETIIAKTKFERAALDQGTRIQGYHTDNGVFKAADFLKEIAEKKQTIRFSGVGAKWQNGVAENAIKIVTSRARTMMIHSALHWPEENDEELWAMAVDGQSVTSGCSYM